MAGESTDNSGTPNQSEEITFTPEQKVKINTIVQERVNEANAGKQKYADDAVAKALAEEREKQRIASLQGEERIKAEYQAQLDRIQAESKAQMEQLKAAQRDLAISKAQAQLAELGLPTDFAINMLGDDDKQTTKNIQTFNTKVNELVTAKVNESLARGPPKTGGATLTQQDAVLAQLREIAHLPPTKG